jgi:hypothetical protein
VNDFDVGLFLKNLTWQAKVAGALLILTKVQGLATGALIMGGNPLAGPSLILTATLLALTLAFCGWHYSATRPKKNVCTHCRCSKG